MPKNRWTQSAQDGRPPGWEEHVQANAVALVDDRDAKIARQRAELTRLGKAIAGLRAAHRHLLDACAIFERNSADATAEWETNRLFRERLARKAAAVQLQWVYESDRQRWCNAVLEFICELEEGRV